MTYNRYLGMTPTIQLLCMFPHPSRHHWFPSWTQFLYITGSMDCSLRIISGRIYCGCSLQLSKQQSSRRAIYRCTMNGKDAWFQASATGIKLNLDSRNNYRKNCRIRRSYVLSKTVVPNKTLRRFTIGSTCQCLTNKKSH